MKSLRNTMFWMVLNLAVQAGTVVHFRTAVGGLDVELYDQEKPITVGNFLKYVTSRAYTQMFFHRAVQNFVIQGGGFAVPRSAQISVVRIPQFPAITNEFRVGPFLPNVAGTIAMAKTADPNSATSEFFFNLKDNPGLNDTNNSGGFTVFGRVISGLDTLTNWNSFSSGPPTQTNLIVNAGSPLNQLPVYRLRTNSMGGYFASLDDFVFVDISRLKAEVTRRDDGKAEIHWVPIPSRTNTVEFSTTLPPQWSVLTNVPPENPGAGVIIDPSGDPHRFYRIRAAY